MRFEVSTWNWFAVQTHSRSDCNSNTDSFGRYILVRRHYLLCNEYLHKCDQFLISILNEVLSLYNTKGIL